MKLDQAFRGMISAAKGAPRALVEKGLREVIRGSFSPNQFLSNSANWGPSEQADLIRRFQHWSAVCARFNGTAVAAIPLRLYATRGAGQSKARHGRKVAHKTLRHLASIKSFLDNPNVKAAVEVEEIAAHPFLKLWEAPNPWSTGAELLYLTQIFQDLCGNGYWNVQRNALGVPDALYVLPSQWVSIVPDPVEFIKGFAFGRSPMDRMLLPPQDVLHFKTPSPHDVLYGSGCLADMVRSHDRNLSADEYEKSLTDNRARPDAILNYKTGRLDEPKRKELQAEWNKLFRGSKNAGKIWVSDYEWDFKTLGFEPSEVAALDIRKWTRLEIADAFGVPVAFLDTENVNKANADAAHEQYARYTVTPRLRRFEGVLNRFVRLYDERLFVAFDNAIPSDEAAQATRLGSHVTNGILTPDEARLELDYEPIDNGDTLWVNGGRLPAADAIAKSKMQPSGFGFGDTPKGRKSFDWRGGCAE